jgi:putative peptidoglycan lipid II flippase
MSESVATESPQGRAAALVIAGGTVVMTLISIVQQALVAGHFGVGAVTDAFFMARNVSDLAGKLLMTGHVTSVFIPLFAERWLRSRDAAWSLTSSVSNALLVLTLAVTMLVVVLAPAIVAFSAPGFPSAVRAQAVWFLRLLFPLNVFTVQATIAVAMLQSLSWFKGAVMANIAGQSAGLLAFTIGVDRFGSAALVLYCVVSAVVTLCYLAVETRRAGYSMTARTRLHAADIRSMLPLLTPFVVSALAAQVSVFYYNRYMSLQGDGAVTVLQYAYRVFQLFVAIAITPWLTVIFPPLTFAAARHGPSGVGERAGAALRFVLVAAVPFGLLLTCFAPETTAMLFQRGAFGAEQTASVAAVLGVFAVGMPLQVMQMFLYRLTIAVRRVRLVNVTWVAMSLGVIPVYAGLSSLWGIRGLAISTLASNLFVIVVLGVALVRAGSLALHGFGRFGIRFGAGLTAMIAVGASARLLLDASSYAVAPPIVRFALCSAAAAAALLLFAWLTHKVALPETREVIFSAQTRMASLVARWRAVDA